MAIFDHQQAAPYEEGPRLPAAPATLVIFNPAAGRTRRFQGGRQALYERLCVLPGVGEVRHTEREGDARRAAERALADGYGRVVVAGGDGTLNDVIQVLAGTTVALGIVPSGTTNVLAHELGIPLDLARALALVEAGSVRCIDLGRANGRYFSMMVGLGIDGQVAHFLRPEIKARYGNLAYWEAGWRTLLAHRPWRMRVEVDPGTSEARAFRRLGSMIVASNTRLYGGRWIKINDRADVADGWLDVFVSHARKRREALRHFAAMAFGLAGRFRDVEFLRGRRLRITTSRPIPYQLDGDAAGSTPIEIELIPGALYVIAPLPGP